MTVSGRATRPPPLFAAPPIENTRQSRALAGERGTGWTDARGADEARPPRDAVGTDNEPTRFAGSGVGWITSIGSIIAERSKRMRERGIRRLAAGWEKLDDRILKDIGVSRHEIESRRDAAYWR